MQRLPKFPVSCFWVQTSPCVIFPAWGWVLKDGVGGCHAKHEKERRCGELLQGHSYSNQSTQLFYTSLHKELWWQREMHWKETGAWRQRKVKEEFTWYSDKEQGNRSILIDKVETNTILRFSNTATTFEIVSLLKELMEIGLQPLWPEQETLCILLEKKEESEKHQEVSVAPIPRKILEAITK